MITMNTILSTSSKLAFPAVYFPARMLFFIDAPAEIGTIHPWEVVLCKQVSDSVKLAWLPHAVKTFPYTTLLSDLSHSEEMLWKAVARQRRQKINQAEALSIKVHTDPYSLDALYARIAAFQRSRQLPVPTRAFVKAVKQCSDVFTISCEGKDVILHVVMKDDPVRAMVMYSCTLAGEEVTNSVRGSLNSYLHWWEMRHYRQRGYHTYDWGGVVLDDASPVAGITRFKREFGGELRHEWHMVLLGNWLRPVGRLLRWRAQEEDQAGTIPRETPEPAVEPGVNGDLSTT